MTDAKQMADHDIDARQASLGRLIEAQAPRLLPIPEGCELKPKAILRAIAQQESTFGMDGGRSRMEKAYRPGGGLHRRHVVDLYRMFGDAAASSWSSWQIMYPTAWELGFYGTPWELRSDSEAIHWVCRYLERRAFARGATTIREIADNYNSGDHRDPFQPTEYMDHVEQFYLEALGG